MDLAHPASPSLVRLVRDGARATILIDRPEKKNALNEAMWLGFRTVADEIAADRDIAVVTVTGSGGAFCAGADISDFIALSQASDDRRRAFGDAVQGGEEAVAALPQPTVARVEGPCVGGGVQILLACDIRIAADDARFGVTPAKLGLAYPPASVRRLARTVGRSAAKDLLFTGRPIGAQEALAIGLVDRVVPAAKLDSEIESLLAQIGANSRFSLAASKQMVDALDDPRTDPEEIDRLWRSAFAGEDLKEGAKAFVEKRRPAFTWRR